MTTLDDEQLDAITESEGESPDDTPRGQLPFPFSKKHSLVVFDDNGKSELCFKEKPSPEVLLEVRRVLGHTFSAKQVNNERFDKLVGIAYQSSTSEAQQLMEDIGSEDFFTLAEELPGDGICLKRKMMRLLLN